MDTWIYWCEHYAMEAESGPITTSHHYYQQMANFSSSTKTNYFHFIQFIHTYCPVSGSGVFGLLTIIYNLYVGIFGKWKFKFKFKIHLWMAWNWLAQPIYHKLHICTAKSNDIKRYCYCFVMSLFVIVGYVRYSVSIALIHIRCSNCVNYGRLGCTI